MRYIQFFLIAIIILLTFMLRFYKVNQIPPSLNWDEVSIGYNAYSILKTGKDEWGQFLPVHFKAYGEYKLPAQIYFSIPGIYIFGLNELGVRITPVVYGTLTVLVVYFLARVLFASSIAGLVACFLLAISPWHIQLTRASFEASFAAFWITLGIYFLVKGFTNNKWFIVSMIPFAISIFTYNSARIFTPIFLLSILILYRNNLINIKKVVISSFIFFIILLIPLMPYIFSADRSSRYKLVSITDDPGLIPRINENRGNTNLPQPFPRLIHNKVTYISYYFIRNYTSHFTPQFLFISGAPHKQHHVQGIGELYLFQAPFLVIGILALWKKKNKFTKLLLSWLFLAFIPVSVTNDSIPHALRTVIAAPFYQLICGFGFIQSISWVKGYSKGLRLVLKITLLTIIIVSFYYYLNLYFNIYPKTYSRDWQYGYKQVVEYIKEHKDEYGLIVFTRHFGEPHMFTLFYLGYDPQKYQTDPNLVRFETFDWVRVLRSDKYYFPDLGDKGTQFSDIVQQNPGKKLLFIGKTGDFSKEKQKLLTINFLNGDPAFEVVDNK